jgi:hypothetical protein
MPYFYRFPLTAAATDLSLATVGGEFQARLGSGADLAGWMLFAFIVFLVCVTSFS